MAAAMLNCDFLRSLSFFLLCPIKSDMNEMNLEYTFAFLRLAINTEPYPMKIAAGEVRSHDDF